jgi:hypothetical protein
MRNLYRLFTTLVLTGILILAVCPNAKGQEVLSERNKKKTTSNSGDKKKKKTEETPVNKEPSVRKVKVQIEWTEKYGITLILEPSNEAYKNKEVIDFMSDEQKEVDLLPNKNYNLTLKAPRFKTKDNRNGEIEFNDYVAIPENGGLLKVSYLRNSELLVEFTSKEELDKKLREQRELEEQEIIEREKAEQEAKERREKELAEQKALEEQKERERKRMEQEYDGYLSSARQANVQGRCADVIASLTSAKMVKSIPSDYDRMFKDCKIKVTSEKVRQDFNQGNTDAAFKLLEKEYKDLQYSEFNDLYNELVRKQAEALDREGRLDQAILLAKKLESNSTNSTFLNSLLLKKEDIDYKAIEDYPNDNYRLIEFYRNYPNSSRNSIVQARLENNYKSSIETKLNNHKYDEAMNAIKQAENSSNILSYSFRSSLEAYKSKHDKYAAIKSEFLASVDLPVGYHSLQINETASFDFISTVTGGGEVENTAPGTHLLRKISFIAPVHFKVQRINAIRIPGVKPFRFGIGVEYFRFANYNTSVIEGITYDESSIEYSQTTLNTNYLVNRLFKVDLIWFMHRNFQFYTPLGFSSVRFNPNRTVEIENEPTDSVSFKGSGLGIGARVMLKLARSASVELQVENSSPFYKTAFIDDQFESDYSSSFFTIKPSAFFMQAKLNIRQFYFSYMLFRSYNQLKFTGVTTGAPGSLNGFKSSTFGIGFNF